MSWRRFAALLGGLSAASVYRALSGEGSRRPLTAKDAGAFFASFPKAGER